DLIEITADSMPRLHAALSQALRALEAGGVRCFLHARGGAEAWLKSEEELILGAGGLGVFGPVELGWLCALALALGQEGAALTRPGTEPVLLDAALAAFEANPASLAAGRVLSYLDGSVRGLDPARVDVAEVLRGSQVFRAIALRALELV
ncbi:MAG TPA: hypothetical protein VE782_12550, partial [Myxococcaceae bacterium]|nr:hypothetical protein [Myxococcaceae bacterium]